MRTCITGFLKMRTGARAGQWNLQVPISLFYIFPYYDCAAAFGWPMRLLAIQFIQFSSFFFSEYVIGRLNGSQKTIN